MFGLNLFFRLEIYDENVDLSSPGPRVLFTGFPKGVVKRLQPVSVLFLAISIINFVKHF